MCSATALLACAILTQAGWAEPDAYAQAYARSQREGIPLVVLISESWCPPCQALKKTIQPWKQRKDIAFVEIGLEHPMAKQLKVVETIPQLLVFKKGVRYTLLEYSVEKPLSLKQVEIRVNLYMSN